MSIEILLLSVNINFAVFSIYLDDIVGQCFVLFILTVAAAESAVGLAIIIVYYRIKGNKLTILVGGNKDSQAADKLLLARINK